METALLNEAYPVGVTFHDTSGNKVSTLTVNVQLYNPSGVAVGSPAAATVGADKVYRYAPATNVLNAYGLWMYEFVPTVTTNITPPSRTVAVLVTDYPLVNVAEIASNANAAWKLALSADEIYFGTVAAGASPTSVPTSDLT